MTRMFLIRAIRAIRGYSFGAHWQGRPPLRDRERVGRIFDLDL
jgi:hypothetical protein